jgi:Domain of unknown function (DUF4145)
VIIECPFCKALVNGTKIAEYEYPPNEFEEYDVENDPWPYLDTMLSCVRCRNSILVRQGLETSLGEARTWLRPRRVYPQPEFDISWDIPANIRNSIIEANKCLNAETYLACAVMCGRALEGICREFKAGPYTSTGLKELLDQGVIDSRLFEWGAEVHRHRNIGAHADENTISQEDASDLFDFTFAICQYIFIMAEKFRKFKERIDPGRGITSNVQ